MPVCGAFVTGPVGSKITTESATQWYRPELLLNTHRTVAPFSAVVTAPACALAQNWPACTATAGVSMPTATPMKRATAQSTLAVTLRMPPPA